MPFLILVFEQSFLTVCKVSVVALELPAAYLHFYSKRNQNENVCMTEAGVLSKKQVAVV